VAALVNLVEIGQRRVGLLDPTARGPDPLAGELREADWDLDRRRRLAGRASRGLSVLPVPAGRRGAGAGQPVERDVVRRRPSDRVAGDVGRVLPTCHGSARSVHRIERGFSHG
jgi:hypothetical protein